MEVVLVVIYIFGSVEMYRVGFNGLFKATVVWTHYRVTMGVLYQIY